MICAFSFSTTPLCGPIGPAPSTGTLSPLDASTFSSPDPTFGLNASLWPILHRVAHLDFIRHSNPPDSDTQAASLEQALLHWQPPPDATAATTPELARSPLSMASHRSSVHDSRRQSILSNAEAYKQAGLVQLFRSVLNHPRRSPRVQMHAKQCLQACLRVVIFGGPMCALLWPICTASTEAVEEVDRNVARTVFGHLEHRQGMKNIVGAWDMVEEGWMRGDGGEERVWRGAAGEEVVLC